MARNVISKDLRQHINRCLNLLRATGTPEPIARLNFSKLERLLDGYKLEEFGTSEDELARLKIKSFPPPPKKEEAVVEKHRQRA